MKHEYITNKFCSLLDRVGVPASQAQKKQILEYSSMLFRWNSRINLVSRKNMPEIVYANLVSSIFYWIVVRDTIKVDVVRIADFGSGGGFPGILLSVFMPDKKIHLVEASRKKSLFLQKVITQLSLNAEVVNERVEDLSVREEEKYDLVVALAFAPLPRLIGYTQPIISKGGKLLTLKGDSWGAELNGMDIQDLRVDQITAEQSGIKNSAPLKNKLMLRLEF